MSMQTRRLPQKKRYSSKEKSARYALRSKKNLSVFYAGMHFVLLADQKCRNAHIGVNFVWLGANKKKSVTG